jgi:hypothetical protein
MVTIQVARQIGIRTLVAVLLAVGAVITLTLRFLKKLRRPTELVSGLRDRALLWPWLTHSTKLVLGTLAYNVFVFLVVEPILRIWFPPLKPWEHVTGVFGSSRTTYEEIVPTVATALWIAGNALVVVLLNRRLQVARDVSKVTQRFEQPLCLDESSSSRLSSSSPR